MSREEEKEKVKARINQYLDAYNTEQLELLLYMIQYYAFSGSKKDIINIAFSDDEKKKLDSGMPKHYVNAIKEVLPSFDTYNYVFNYNKSIFGEMSHIFEALNIKLLTVLNESHFDKKI